MGKSISSPVPVVIASVSLLLVVDPLGTPALSGAGVAHDMSALRTTTTAPPAARQRIPTPRAPPTRAGTGAIRRLTEPGRDTHISDRGLKKRPLTRGELEQARVLYFGANRQKRKATSLIARSAAPQMTNMLPAGSLDAGALSNLLRPQLSHAYRRAPGPGPEDSKFSKGRRTYIRPITHGSSKKKGAHPVVAHLFIRQPVDHPSANDGVIVDDEALRCA